MFVLAPMRQEDIMEAEDFQALVDRLGDLTKEQREALIEAVDARASACDAMSLIDCRFAAAPRCPHCQSVDVGTWSKPKPLTRYMCHGCGRTFTALTGTPLERLRRRDAWLAYGQALADGISLRKAATRCGIVLDTAFRWRHRFLELPKSKKATAISGIVEVDETYFLKSQKGARKVEGRKARKRGGKALKPGLSDEHAPVLIARDRTGATTDAMLDKVDTASVARHLGPVVQKDTLLISDGAKVYAAFAAARGFLHVWIIASKGEHVWQGYHIQNVNAYTSGLKTWMVRFKGVATKYLDSYLGWRRKIDRDGDGLSADRWLTAAIT
jgi:transposase-like protein